METYKIIRKGGYIVGIKCLVCGRISYNDNDIKYKYCGHCHEFHDMLQRIKANGTLPSQSSSPKLRKTKKKITIFIRACKEFFKIK